MAHYIDADRLRAEIEKRKQIHFNDYFVKKSGNPADYGASNALAQVLPLIDSLQQERPEVDYNEFEKLFSDFCERNKGHHITGHDACMWFWELGLNARNV